jgi:hypothetical protein
VLDNKAVAEKYKGWKDTINKNISVLPVSFFYIEGNYVTAGSIDGSHDYIEKYGIPKYSVLKKVGNNDIDDYIKKITTQNGTFKKNKTPY